MSPPVPVPVQSSAVERHFQSFALALITAAALFMASFVVTAREESASTREKLNGIATQMQAVQLQLSTMQGNYVTREEWRDHEMRLRANEANNKARK